MTTNALPRQSNGFQHEAFVYESDDEFVSVTREFLDRGLEAEDVMLVVVAADKIAALRGELGAAADDIQFADMHEVGANPARIIPAWTDFLADRGRPGRGARGIGEPIWSGRSQAELAECHVHEALLNYAFTDAPAGAIPWRLLCPYDARSLTAEVIEQAHSDPSLDLRGRRPASESVGPERRVARPLRDQPAAHDAAPRAERGARRDAVRRDLGRCSARLGRERAPRGPASATEWPTSPWRSTRWRPTASSTAAATASSGSGTSTTGPGPNRSSSARSRTVGGSRTHSRDGSAERAPPRPGVGSGSRISSAISCRYGPRPAARRCGSTCESAARRRPRR